MEWGNQPSKCSHCGSQITGRGEFVLLKNEFKRFCNRKCAANLIYWIWEQKMKEKETE